MNGFSWISTGTMSSALRAGSTVAKIAKAIAVASSFAVALWISAAPSARANDVPNASPKGSGSGAALTLEEALKRAMAFDPALRSATHEVNARDASALQAAASYNPELSVSGENFGGSGTYQGTKRLETTVSINQKLDTSGSRGARVRFAETARTLAQYGVEAARLDSVRAVRKAFFEVLAAQKLLALEEQALETAKSLDALVTRRQRAGAAASPAEALSAGLDIEKAALRLDQARGRLAAARSRLALRWGEADPSFSAVSGEVALPMELPPFATLVGRLDGSLDGAKWKAELSSHTANVAVEEARSRPDLTVSGGLRHFQDEGKVAAVVGASVSLPVFDRNTGGIREAEERLRGAASNADTSRLKAANELSLAYEHLSSLHREAKAIAQTLLPKARSVYDTLERAYRHGASTYVELSAAQKTMLELATRRIEVESAFLTSLIEVERLTAPAAAGR